MDEQPVIVSDHVGLLTKAFLEHRVAVEHRFRKTDDGSEEVTLKLKTYNPGTKTYDRARVVWTKTPSNREGFTLTYGTGDKSIENHLPAPRANDPDAFDLGPNNHDTTFYSLVNRFVGLMQLVDFDYEKESMRPIMRASQQNRQVYSLAAYLDKQNCSIGWLKPKKESGALRVHLVHHAEPENSLAGELYQEQAEPYAAKRIEIPLRGDDKKGLSHDAVEAVLNRIDAVLQRNNGDYTCHELAPVRDISAKVIERSN